VFDNLHERHGVGVIEPVIEVKSRGLKETYPLPA
jgi:hypothetical protein